MKLVPVKLRDLTLDPDDGFETVTLHRRGRVLSWGWYPWDDGTGRQTRVRAVLVTYGTVQVVHRADMVVLVPADRPHARISDETRWNDRLPEPGSFATVGDRVVTKAAGRRQAQDQRSERSGLRQDQRRTS